MKLDKKILSVAGAGLLLLGTNLYAAERSANDILSNAYQYMGSMDKYTFNAVVSVDKAENGELVKKFNHDVSVKVDRPAKLRIDTKGDLRNRSTYFNEGLYSMIDENYGYYAQFNTPETIDATLDVLFEKYGMKKPLAYLIYSDMDKRAKFKKSKNFGSMDVGGVECDYVAFKTKKGEVHVWIATGDKPLIKSYSIIDTQTPGHPRVNASISWNTNPNISDSDFIFSAPKNASKISVKRAN